MKRLKSGEYCTTSGEWEVIGPIGTTSYFKKGQQLPLYLGKVVTWALIRAG